MSTPYILTEEAVAEQNLRYRERLLEAEARHEHVWVTVTVNQVADPSATVFEQDSATVVSWVGPHCALCGDRWTEEVGVRCTQYE